MKQDLRARLGRELLFFDGAMGTVLQTCGLRPGEDPAVWNRTRPGDILAVHRAYRASGADILTSNTFGCNACKLPNGADVTGLIRDAVVLAKEAADGAYVALDIGPTGLLPEPYGPLSFARAVAVYAECVRAGADAGADCILIETMSDLYEAKAALLAAKENCDLPVFLSFTMQQNGRTLGGADAECCAMLAEGLSADAVGINCGFGPEQALPVLQAMRACTTLPLFVNPNAGLPVRRADKTVYDIDPDTFAAQAEALYDAGAAMLGGCCGTTPAHILSLTRRLCGRTPLSCACRTPVARVSSGSVVVRFGEKPVVIGERLNPTGKKALKAALTAWDEDFILREAVHQCDSGADILDVNVGVPGLDEVACMPRAVKLLQGVVSTPLSIDTTNPAAAEAALRVYNGTPLLNSVCGKQSSMDAVFPLAKKYGAMLVALTLDEDGIPDTAEGRLRIAERIEQEAARYGIGRHRLIFDPLTMAVSTGEGQAETTLAALHLIGEKYSTVLGVSNVSFGLPSRPLLNAVFLARALDRGLSAAIMNPGSDEMTGTIRAFCALAGKDPGAADYLAYAANSGTETKAAAAPAGAETVRDAICRGLSGQAVTLTRAALEKREPTALIREELIPALESVGAAFEAGRIFLPQLMTCAECARGVFAAVRERMPQSTDNGCLICLATVEGDVHDIGKNIVRMVLESYGYRILDLGRDVPPQTIADAVLANHIRLVGLSALMTTTVGAMEQTLKLLRKVAPECAVMVGGAVLNADYAASIGADFYCRDAMDDVRAARSVFGNESPV